MSDHDLSATGSTLLVLLRDQRDEQAWANFVTRYRPKVLAWCRRWGTQEADAEDVTQDVLAKLCQKIGGFAYDPAKGSFRGWLKTVAIRALSDAMEARRRHCTASGASGVFEQLQAITARDDLAATLEQEFDLELMAAAAERVRAEVSARDWKIFNELAIEGRSGQEVAEALEMKVATVLVVRGRVQKRIRDVVRQFEP